MSSIQEQSVFAILAGFQAVVLAYQVYISVRFTETKQGQHKKKADQKATLERLSRGGGAKR